MISQDELNKWIGIARRDDWHMQFVGSDIRVMLAEIERLRSVHRAASDYFMCAVQDEADDLECCTTERQHELAKALRDALDAVGGSPK